MKYSRLFGKTRFNAPCDADSVNAKLLTQAGFVEKMAAGIYYFLPLGFRVLEKINKIIREEMNAIDGQEVLLPALQPASVWETTGRDKTMVDTLFTTTGAGERNLVFGATHEEAVTPLVAKYVNSYKDLPLSVYQLQTKFRNEPRAKSGLLRGREFGMKDMYSFHATEEDLDAYYERAMQAYLNVYTRCGLKAYVVEASGGAFTDKYSHEFSVVTPAGEDTILICEKTGKAQNIEIAFGLPLGETAPEEEKPLSLVEVVRDLSVEANALAHQVSAAKILKTVVYVVDGGGFLGVLIRGDLHVNELKLTKYLQKNVRAATPDELRSLGLVQGFISPVGLPDGVNLPFIADKSIKDLRNMVTGGNKLNYDYVNVNLGRDFVVADFADLVEVREGFLCLETGEKLIERKAVEAGNIFKLGTKFSQDFKLNYTDKDGVSKPVIMGCYGIGNTRLVGTIVEAMHDENGIIWPKSVTPYHVHLVTLGKDDAVMAAAEKLYSDLQKNGFDVLFDDRDLSAGIKLKDADLIGIPLRMVISKKTLEAASVEWKVRSEEQSSLIVKDDLMKRVSAFYN